MNDSIQHQQKGLVVISLILISIYFFIFGYDRVMIFDHDYANIGYNVLGIAIFGLGILLLMRAWRSSPFYHDKTMMMLFNIIAVIIFIHMAPLRALGVQTALCHLLEMVLFSQEVLHNVMVVFGVIVTIMLGLITYQIAPRDNLPQDKLDWMLLTIVGILLGWFIIALFINPFQSLGLSGALLFAYFSFLSRRRKKNIYGDE